MPLLMEITKTNKVTGPATVSPETSQRDTNKRSALQEGWRRMFSQPGYDCSIFAQGGSVH